MKVQGKRQKLQGKKRKAGDTGHGSQAKGKRRKEERRNTEPGERTKAEGK